MSAFCRYALDFVHRRDAGTEHTLVCEYQSIARMCKIWRIATKSFHNVF